MNNPELAQSYFDAWNARDAGAILALLGPDGTYEDPGTPGPIGGAAMRSYVEGLWTAFPDLQFEIRSHSMTGPDSAAAQWTMRGTQRGPMNGLPPTGASVMLNGADFFTFRNGHIARITGYFDSADLPRQLGLNVIVQPGQIGPFGFGVSTVVQSGKSDVPGAISLTNLSVRGPDEAERVRNSSRESLVEMLKMDGFLGATTSQVGPRMATITAWKDAASARKVMREGTHATAMQQMLDGELADFGRTSVWVLARDNGVLVRCPSCGKMTRAPEPGADCRCGAPLPEPPPFW